MGFLFKVIALIAIGALSTKKGRDFVQNILQICWPTVFPPTEEKDGKTIDADVEPRSKDSNDHKSKKKQETKEREEESVNSNS
jgi:hypothetical protein